MGTTAEDEPLTPAGRLFLQPELNQVILCVLGAKQPLDLSTVRSVIAESLMIKHPRFSCLMVRDSTGREHWRKTTVDIERHIIVRHEPFSYTAIDNDLAVNEYLADLSVSSPLPTDKPLWEIHLLLAHNCTVLRVHHALGDGISLMSLLLTCCRKAEDPEQMPTVNPTSSDSGGGRRAAKGGRWGMFGGGVWKFLKVVVLSLVFVVEFVLRSLWVKDKRTAVSGGEGLELWPRKIATASFLLDDMKTVKNAVANATINDVLFAVISSGLSRYLDLRAPKTLQDGAQITGVAMVNLRPHAGLQDMKELVETNSGTGWGNKFGMLLLPIYYHRGGSDPLQYLKRAKKMIDKKKTSLEAYLSYTIGYFVMHMLGAKFACLLNYRILCNTTFTISNVVGPKEAISIGGIPVDYIRATSTSLPHAITMHMVSYAGKAEMQILVAKDLIPDPEVIAKSMEDSLLEMKEAAQAAVKAQGRKADAH